MTCTDYSVWLFAGLLIVNLAYWVCSEIIFWRKRGEMERRLSAIIESEWRIK